MKLLVVGGTGVLGRHAVPALVSAGHDVTANTRNEASAELVSDAGATPTTFDVFDPTACEAAVDGHDAVVNIATSIPSGVGAAFRRSWATNDRLRTHAATNLANAAAARQLRYVGESITFPYDAMDDRWIDESVGCSYFWGNESCRDAEQAAASVTAAGGAGVALRFAMFFAPNSSHGELIETAAKRGIFVLAGSTDAYVSMIDVRDAAQAVVAATEAPPGIYNVAEPEPVRRADHAAALAKAVGRSKLRAVPALAVKAGGAALESLSRSHRISSASLSDATPWRAEHHTVIGWAS